MGIESWHGDAPVYSEAVCDAKDTYYYGSDDDDYENPAERRQRYEAAAQRFLAGEQGSILLSASLRGPFGYSDGWLNPWRSKRHDRALHTASQPMKSTPRPSQNEKPTTAQASLECHLPSPESLKQVEIEPHPFLEEEEVKRVRRWQKSLQPPKGHDEFTTKNPTGQQASTSQKKRRANSSDWLRQSSSKKRKAVGATDIESVKTPTRRPRKAIIPASSSGPSSSLRAPYESNQLYPGRQDYDELGVDDGLSQVPISSSLRAQSQHITPTKRVSPKRAMLRNNKPESAESADELSQETAKDTQAAATLSSPVSLKRGPTAPPTRNNGSPAKQLRTPRIRKSRTNHKIEALRAPLPRPETKRVEVATTEGQMQPEERPKSTLEIQEKVLETAESSGISNVIVEAAPAVRASSPLSSISSSYGSVSWSGISSPDHNVAPSRNTTTSEETTDSATHENQSEDAEEDDHPGRGTFTSGNAVLEAPVETGDVDAPFSDDGLDPNIDASSELSDISMRDIYLRNSSVARMDEMVSATEKERLDAELDSDDAASSGPEEEDYASSDYATADSQVESREATPVAVPASLVVEDSFCLTEPEEMYGEPSNSSPTSEKAGVQLGHATQSEVVQEADQLTTRPSDETIRDSYETTSLLKGVDKIVLASGKSTQDQPPNEEVVDASTNSTSSTTQAAKRCVETFDPEPCVNQLGLAISVTEGPGVIQAEGMQPVTEQMNVGTSTAIGPIMSEAIPQSSFECTLSDDAANPLPVGRAAEPSTPPQPSTPEQPFRPFADFLSPSPEKRARQRRRAQMQASLRRVPGADGTSLSSILRSPWSDSKLKKRVSFAPLPNEEVEEPFSTAPEQPGRERPASPPPQTAVEHLPTSSEAEFQGHFNAMARRASKAPHGFDHVRLSPIAGSQDHNGAFGTPLAADKVSNSSEPSDTEAPAKSMFEVPSSENNPPCKAMEDFDDVFDDLASMLRPYDLDAELDEARTGGKDMEGISFGGW